VRVVIGEDSALFREGLSRLLTENGHDVVVIDKSAEAFSLLPPGFEARTIVGIGFDRDVMTAAGIENADAFAAVSSGDNSNIISARLARETFGVDRVVARIYDPKRAEVYERLGIPTVATVRWTADRIVRHLVPDGQHEVWRDPTSAVAIVEIPVNPSWISRPVRALEDATGARVAYLMRFGLGTLPTPSMLIQDGDQIFMLVTDDMTAGVTKVAAAAPEGGH